MTSARNDRDRLLEHIDAAIDGLDMYGAEQHVETLHATKIHELRRLGSGGIDHKLGTVSLIERDGILQWVDGLGFRQRSVGRRRRRGSRRGADIVRQLKFARLAPNSVGAALQTLDTQLNAKRGLRAWSSPGRARVAEPAKTGRILLMLHGTFSKSEAMLDALGQTDAGNAFFATMRGHYDQVLSYDHATLSMPPLYNAVDLARQLAASDATVDIVCHSRGGLVVRWLVEALMHNPMQIGRVVFVGAPLGGTSLAAPPRLRSGLDLLTNVANVLSKGSAAASSVVPLFTAVTGILRVFGSVTSALAKTPLIDATVYMIPGLAAQSMTGDNTNIVRLREGVTRDISDRYFAVTSAFKPVAPGWEFWKYFQNPGSRIASHLTHRVFAGANDLVVDTDSMTRLSDDLVIAPGQTLALQSDALHHLIYFERADVLQFIERSLLQAR